MPELREALEAAFTQADGDAAPAQETEAPASGTDTSVESTAATESEAPASEPRADGRDSLGRFTKAEQPDGKGQLPPTAPKPPEPALEQRTPTFEKPPRGIPVPLRAHWTGLSPEWRTHLTEVHNAVQQVQQQYQPSAEFASRFMQTIAPFQQAIMAETGGASAAHAVQAVEGLMRTASTLRYGTPNEKAQTIAKLVQVYGVDVQSLDNALVGALPPEGQQGFNPQMIEQAVQRSLAPLMQRAQQHRAQAEQRTAEEVRSELQAFAADPKNEYFDDVRDIMADMVEVAIKQGRDLPLAEAYQRACYLHPDISKLMIARQGAKTAQSLTQAAQRAKAAAVSVNGSAPVGNPNPDAPASVREAIEAAIEAHTRV